MEVAGDTDLEETRKKIMQLKRMEGYGHNKLILLVPCCLKRLQGFFASSSSKIARASIRTQNVIYSLPSNGNLSMRSNLEMCRNVIFVVVDELHQ